jgi:hypothetical protein
MNFDAERAIMYSAMKRDLFEVLPSTARIESLRHS